MGKSHALDNVRLFAGLEPQQLEAITAAGEPRSYDIGETIFAEGDPGTHLYCVCAGRVEITLALGNQADQAPVHVATDGSVFGEFVLFETVARTATARAVKPVEILAIGAAELRAVFAADPEAGYRVMDNLCRILVGRIQKTTKELKSSLMW